MMEKRRFFFLRRKLIYLINPLYLFIFKFAEGQCFVFPCTYIFSQLTWKLHLIVLWIIKILNLYFHSPYEFFAKNRGSSVLHSNFTFWIPNSENLCINMPSHISNLFLRAGLASGIGTDSSFREWSLPERTECGERNCCKKTSKLIFELNFEAKKYDFVHFWKCCHAYIYKLNLVTHWVTKSGQYQFNFVNYWKTVKLWDVSISYNDFLTW